MEEKGFPKADPEGFCGRFDRIDMSLIEEPEYCEVCKFFCDRDSTCRFPEKVQ